MLDLVTNIIVRVCIITAVFSILSHFLVRRYAETPGRLKMSVSLLFVVFGAVTLINILYVLKIHNVLNPA
ncbi:MAG: hypothetical protein KGI33_07315 [Thaumarchaeota archaeon]|nr:hypothetical protein [Nitrososphaerota archaeon]